MIHFLEISKYHHLQVWLDELPVAGLQTTHLPANARLAAVEAFKVTGPRSIYGLLGGAFTPQDQKTFELKILPQPVNLSTPFKSRFSSSLNQTFVGLPEEYLDGLKNAAKYFETEQGRLPAGVLTISCGAHGPLYSCEIMFEWLTVMLLTLFNSPDRPSENGLIDLWKQANKAGR